MLKANKEEKMKELVVIALGGNAILQANQKGTDQEQFANVDVTCRQLVQMNKLGYKLVVTHGNGPQAGNLLIQEEEGKKYVPAQPLNIVGAMTQGQIGYMFQNRLQNDFYEKDKHIPTIAVITQILVNGDDPDFQNPTKPVGPFYTKEVAAKLRKEKGYIVKEVKPGVEKSWRRVVPSPEPIKIIEKEAILSLIKEHAIIVACGGGGIPVVKNKKGFFKGVEAVIDKDKCGNVLANTVNAEVFLILTDVENAMINFGKENQKAIGKVTVSQMEELVKEGHFLAGSMGPKVEAALRFVKSGGKKSIITSLAKAIEALEGKTGTIITAN